MKASKQCPKCHSLKVGYLETGPSCVLGSEQVEGTGKRSWFEKVFDEPAADPGLKPVSLEAYLCAECGYYETYVNAPATVNFDRVVGLRWVNEATDATTPYR